MSMLFALVLAVAAEGAEPAAFRWKALEADVPAGTVLTPCPHDGDAAASTRRTLEQISGEVTSLGDGDPRALLARLDALLATPCFALARSVPDLPIPATGAELGHWWESGASDRKLGARWWFASFLDLGNDLVGFEPRWTLPPDVVKAAPEALQPLLCATSEETCGSATEGWRVRAESWCELRARLSYSKSDCADVDIASHDPEALARWVSCLRERQPARAVIPLGRFRAPSTGWLIVSGRRGHYRSCDEVRAYSLATGAAWIASMCSGPVRRRGGDVEIGPPEGKTRLEILRGRVALDNLREAAWAMAVAPYASRLRRLSSLPVPPGLPVQLRGDRVADGRLRREITCFGDCTTTLQWAWRDGARVVLKGELEWPGADDDAEAFAAHQLNVAEASFTAGCAKDELPPLPVRAADPGRLNVHTAELARALQDAARKPCGAKVR